jgi:RHS repeat-associated protein
MHLSLLQKSLQLCALVLLGWLLPLPLSAQTQIQSLEKAAVLDSLGLDGDIVPLNLTAVSGEFEASAASTSSQKGTPARLTARDLEQSAQQAFKSGRFSAALDGYGEALALAKSEVASESPESSAAPSADQIIHRSATKVAEQALAGRAQMLARLGRMDELETLFESDSGAEVRGRAGQLLRNAKEGLHLMQHRPDLAFLCGPTALQSLYAQAEGRPHPRIHAEASTRQGVSLARLGALAGEVELPLQMAFREEGAADFITPAVVHWGVGHYASILETRNDHYRVVDPTFGQDFWIAADVLDTEASGYFLVGEGALPEGWRSVAPAEASEVWGRGSVRSRNTRSTRQSDHRSPKNQSCGLGMAAYSAHLHMVSLGLTDIPLAYTPAYGPEIAFQLDYVERDLSQPATLTHGHLGSQWLHSYHSFLDVTTNLVADTHKVEVALPGGGSEAFDFPSILPTDPPAGLSDSSIPLTSLSPETGNRLQAVYLSFDGQTWSLLLYRLHFPDGSFYSYGAGGQLFLPAPSAEERATRLYMTGVTSSRGNTNRLSLSYGSSVAGALRLETITDASGGVAEVLYPDRLASFPALSFDPGISDPLHIVGFIDPAGRHAQVHYDATGRLEKIVDAVGIESSVTYTGASDQVDSLTTPYGTALFRRGTVIDDPDIFGWLEMEDALGRVERLEYTQRAPGVSPADPDAPDRAQVLIRSSDSRQFRNTFYWDHQAWSKHRGDYTQAQVYHWLHSNFYALSTGALESYQAPQSSRVYYNYPGMVTEEDATLADRATLLFPSKIARLDDEGGTWLETRQYNDAGNLTQFVDAAGRITDLAYEGASGFTPADVRLSSVTVANSEIVRYSYANSFFPLLPTRIEYAGQAPIDLVYNSVGQLLTSTQDGDTTSYLYHQPDGSATKGNLLSIVAPASLGTLTSFTYDSVNRVASITDADGRTHSFSYDDLDRLTTVQFPDGSQEVTDYGGRLFPESLTDRLGRLTTWDYDLAGQLIAETRYGLPTEAALQGVGAQTTHYQWCDCGSLSGLIDPSGKHTAWEHDVLGRVIRKTTPDGRSQQFNFTPALGRLASETHADGSQTDYRHSPVGELLAVDFSDGLTPGFRYGYDLDFGWLETVATVAPGTETVLETVSYQYHPYAASVAAAVNGAGQLASEIGTLPESTVRYGYDTRGRQITESLLDAAQAPVRTTSWTLDALDRITAHSNPLGSFGYTYGNASSRLDARSLPGNLNEAYSFESPAAGGRLSAVTRRIGAGSPFVAYNYIYQSDDRLASSTETRPSQATLETTYRYDSQERLTHALTSEDGTAADRFEYLYDLSGNRVTALSPERTAHWNADPDNRPLAQAAVGFRRVVGTVSKPSHVKINGAYVPVDNDLRFEGFVDTLITRNVQIEATDITGNITTQDYWFEEPQNTGGIVYQSDARGNLIEVLTTETITTYQWDALDRLTVAERLSNDGTSGLRKNYHFDPASRLSRIEVETWDGSTWQSASVENYVFAGIERIQKRTADGTTVLRNYYADGFTEGGINYLYGRDRLGSIVELIDASNGSVVSRRDFSPFGIVRNESGSVQADFAYTGHFYDPELALHHSPTRVYDAGLGRWLSADIYPDAELLPEGTNLYAYVGNDPINFTDPLGLCRSSNNRSQANRPPPKQSGNSGSGGGDPPKRTASSASPQDGGGAGGGENVFWSGSPQARAAAEAFAKQTGGKTLEMTRTGKLLDAMTNKRTYPFLKSVWNAASRRFAKRAGSSTHVFQSAKGVRLKSVWATKEYPRLIKQGTNIIYHTVP